jgi:hypothetical protein
MFEWLKSSVRKEQEKEMTQAQLKERLSQAKNELLGNLIVATKSKSPKEQATLDQLRASWTSEIEHGQISDPLLRKALEDILKLIFDANYFPIDDDYALWIFMSNLLGREPSFYTKAIHGKIQERILFAHLNKQKDGSLTAPNFLESIKNYRTYAIFGCLLKQVVNHLQSKSPVAEPDA